VPYILIVNSLYKGDVWKLFSGDVGYLRFIVTPYDVHFARNMYSKQFNVDTLHLSVYIYTSYNGCCAKRGTNA
jgi:hypothetical protein